MADPDGPGAKATTQTAADTAAVVDSPGYRWGRPLRALAACDENVLRECPEERFKFSGLGAVIVGTSSLAALSMAEAIALVFAMSYVGALWFGLIWGGFIMAVDRWLVATGKGLKHYLPRIAMAIILGVVVAEPFVLRAFDDAIDERIAEETADKVDEESREYHRCNPHIDDALQPDLDQPDCGRHLLSLTRPTTPTIPEVPPELAAQHASLSTQLANLNTSLGEARAAVTAEELGLPGAGNSGEPGIGLFTEARREVVDGLLADIARVNEQFRPVDDERTRILGEQEAATAEAETAALTYNEAREPAIEAAVNERRADLSEEPRLSRRWITLVDLMFDSLPIFVARVLLSLFFITIDTAPALIKMSTSGGTYDRLVEGRLATAEERADTDRAIETEHNQARLREEQARIRHEVEKIERDYTTSRHLDLARIEHERDQEVARQEQQLLAAAAARRNGG